MISLNDFVILAKKGGVIDDSTNKPMEFGTVLGFCCIGNYVIGVLLNDKNYVINEAYVGEDKLVHYSEWYASGVVTKEKMNTSKGIAEFNSKIPVKCRKIKNVMLLNGELIGLTKEVF